jgi:hypothetical protein
MTLNDAGGPCLAIWRCGVAASTTDLHCIPRRPMTSRFSLVFWLTDQPHLLAPTVHPARKRPHQIPETSRADSLRPPPLARVSQYLRSGVNGWLTVTLQLNAKIGTLNRAEYDRVRLATDAFRTSSKEARFVLERHMASHNCYTPFQPQGAIGDRVVSCYCAAGGRLAASCTCVRPRSLFCLLR